LDISFNNDVVDSWSPVCDAEFFVNKGSGTHEFNVTVKPRNWGSQGDFSVSVGLWKVPFVIGEHNNLDWDEKMLTFDSEILESTEAISQKIDLSIGGTVEVTDPESIINGVKLIIPPVSSEKSGGKSIATISISYIDDPYSLELPDNRGFLLPPVVINSDVILEVECILKIPYTEADLSNVGLSSNENIKVYRYNYNSPSWEEISINKKSSRDMSDILEITFKTEDINRPYACTFRNSPPPSDPGYPQPGDLLYKLSNYNGIEGWLPGHVGIYVGEKAYDGVIPYNVIEALFNGVKRTYKNPISAFSGSATYMGARQPKSGILNPGQRKVIVTWAETIAELELPYAIGQSFPGILFGMLKGNMVKGALGSYNCVGLAEKAYEIVGVNLVSDWAEGNYCPISQYSSSCVLTPAEQYNKTEPAEGYTVSGRVTDSQGNGIPGVTLNLELVSFNNYHSDIIKVTNSGGYWSSNKLGREWKVSPQKDGYTFEPSTLHEGWVKPDPSTWIVKENANDIDFTGMSDELQNHAPIISSLTVDPHSININETTTITCTASDEDVGDILTYTWNKSGGTFEGSTSGSSITWRAPSTEGNYTVSCEVSDGEGSDSEQVIISVGDVNHAPVITSTAVTSAIKDELYSYDVNATDADTLTYSLTTKPSGMGINSSTGLITWTPTTSGDYNVTVKVSDGELFDTQSFTVTVEENGTSLGQVQLITPFNGATLPPGGITFSWNPVTNATKYQFILYNSLGQVALDAIDSGTSSIVGLDIEETITWKIRAGDNSGNWGAWSSTWSLTVQNEVVGGIVTGISAMAWAHGLPLEGVLYERYIQLQWDSYPGAIGYNIYRSVNQGEYSMVYQSTDIFCDHDVSVGNSYAYYVTAYGSGWETTPSEIIIRDTWLPCPSLISPGDGSTIINPNPTFTWNPAGISNFPYGSIYSGSNAFLVHTVIFGDDPAWRIDFPDLTTSTATYDQNENALPLVTGNYYDFNTLAWGFDKSGTVIAQSCSTIRKFYYNGE
jgi:hypothetical protein